MDLKQSINTIIRGRRALYPKSYLSKPIPKAVIEDILENGRWAPNHKKTEPWRFKVILGNALPVLGKFMAEEYEANSTATRFSETKMKQIAAKPEKAGCVIVIVLHRDPEERLPEWEELSAVACAVQNMWLSATAQGIGAYWSTPGFVKNANEFLGLDDNEICLGFFYMGYVEEAIQAGERKPLNSVVEWVDFD